MNVNVLQEHPTAAKTVIAAMLQSEMTAMSVLAELSAPDFAEPIHQLVVYGIERAMLSIEPYDVKLVSECVTQHMRENKSKTNMPPTLIESMVQEDSTRWRGYMETVKRFAQYRKAIAFAEWVNTEVTGYVDMDELYPQLLDKVEQLHSTSMTDAVTLGKDTHDLYNYIMMQRQQMREDDELKLFDWPWESWNSNVNPLRAGLMGIIAAPDGMGKSSALEQIAEYWAEQGHQVVFVHCENDIDYTLDRRKSRLTNIDITQLEAGQLDKDEVNIVINSHHDWFNNLHYVDGAGKTCEQILNEVSDLQSRGLCDALVIDYLNKIRPSRGQAKMYAGRAYEAVADNTERLKSAGVKGRYPVLTAAQMVKGAQEKARYGEKLTRDGMRGSGELSDKVQLVLTLSREILENNIAAPNGVVTYRAGEYSPRAHWRIDKQNRGRTGDFQQFFIGRRFMFQDIEKVAMER